MSYIKRLFIFCLFFLSISVFAQTPIRFIHTYGNFSYNYGMSVHQEADTGYVILANVTGNSGNNNIQLFKIDKNGGYVWSKLYADSAIFWGESLKRTPDHGYLITGYTNKTDTAGYDVMLIKTDSVGNKEWEHYYGGTDWDFGNDVTIASDSNYLVCGSTYSYGAGNTDMYLLKINTQGDTLWTKTFGGAYEDVATSIDVCKNGDILMAGYTKSYGAGNYDALLVRYDSAGNYLWYKAYGDTAIDKIYSVRENYNKDIVLGGYTSSFGAGGDDFYLIYADSLGAQKWYQAVGGPDNERAYTMDLTADSGYVLSGTTSGAGYQDVYFYKMLANGQWNYSTSHGSVQQDNANAIKQTLDGGYIIVGSSSGFGGCLSNVFVIKTGVDGLSVPYNSIFEFTSSKTNTLKIYPNPFSSQAVIELPNEITKPSIFYLCNSLGNLVFKREIAYGAKNFILNRNNLSEGIYYYRWVDDKGIRGSGKVVICK